MTQAKGAAGIPPEPQEAGRTTRRGSRLARWSLYVLGVILFVAVLVKAGPADIAHALAGARWSLVAAFVAIDLLVILGGAVRWAVLIRSAERGARSTDIISAYLSNAFLSNLSPARSGDAFVPVLLKSRSDIPSAVTFAAIAVDRVLDVAMLSLFSVASALLIGEQIEATRGIRQTLLIASGVLVGIGAAFVVAVATNGTGVHRWVARLATVRPLDRILATILSFRARAAAMGRPEALAVPAALSALTWTLQMIGLCCLVNAFISVPLLHSVVAQLSALVAGAVSMIPGGIGVTTLSYVFVFGALGHPWQPIAAATSLGFVVRSIVRAILGVCAEIAWTSRARRAQ